MQEKAVLENTEQFGTDLPSLPKGEAVNAKQGNANQIKSVYNIRSPLDIGTVELRKRPGYHQTWLRAEDVERYKEVGYSNIQKPNSDPAKYEKEIKRPGSETGEILRRSEGENKYIYAMEVPEELYQQHLNAVSALSHARYNSQADVLREYVAGTNRDVGSRMEVIEDSGTYDEELAERNAR